MLNHVFSFLTVALALAVGRVGTPSVDQIEIEIATPATMPIPPDYTGGCRVAAPPGFNAAIEAAATEHGIPPWAVAVTAWRESGCKRTATGAAGEIGLMQINPTVWTATLKKAGIIRASSDLYNATTNLRAGAYILARIHAKTGDLETTFARYNGSGGKARAYARDQMRVYTAVSREMQ